MSESDLILLAIDDEQSMQLFVRTLAMGSYKMAVARDRTALEKALQESSPALVIINQNFDHTDAAEITAALLGRFPTLPVLLFLDHPSLEAVKKAMSIGASDCLLAPLRTDQIMQTVENSFKRASRLGDWTRRQIKMTTASLQRQVEELQKFGTILENIDDGVIILDDKLDILLINAAVRRMFGLWLEEDVNGKPAMSVLPHPDLKALIQMEKAGFTQTPHHEISFADGRVVTAQSVLIPGIGIAITMQDITYLRQIDRVKNEFISTVSHDLRSPLTAILGYVELLDRVGPINDQQYEFIHRVQGSVGNITALISNLLDLGRIEAGLDTQNEVVSLDALLRYSLKALEGQIAEKNLNLHLHLPEKIPAVRGNPIRLRQMFANLLGNAIKNTPNSGNITTELEAQGEQVILRISDNGPGIPPADQPHIFEKFYRASNVPNDVGGTGLGLAIVKYIVDSHQGRIWVESQLGQGSTFTVVLPYSRMTIP